MVTLGRGGPYVHGGCIILDRLVTWHNSMSTVAHEINSTIC